MMKLVVALAFLALASASAIGYNSYYVNILDNQIVVKGIDGRQVEIFTKYYPTELYGQQYGQQYIKLYVNGPDVPVYNYQYIDQAVTVGRVYQSDILYQIFSKYVGQLDYPVYNELLSVVGKYVENGEISPAVLYALQYIFYQSQEYLYLGGYFTVGENSYYQGGVEAYKGLYGSNYKQQYPYGYGGSYYKYLQGYGAPSTYKYGSYGPYSSKYGSQYGSYYPYSSQYGSFYPYSSQYGSFYPYSSQYGSQYGSQFGSYYPYGKQYGSQYGSYYPYSKQYASHYGSFGPYSQQYGAYGSYPSQYGVNTPSSYKYQGLYGYGYGNQQQYGSGYYGQGYNQLSQYGSSPSVYQSLKNTGIQGQYQNYPYYNSYSSLY